MRKIKVLIVDDHALMRDGISALLNVNDDIEVIGEASEGKEAIKKMAELKPDVVVMDIAMPNMDGMEATRQIVKANREVKVLILTQHENKEYVLSAIKAGASGFVPKKALGSELVSAIRSVYRGDSFLHPSVATALIEDYRRHTGMDPFDKLTTRERDILRHIAEGHTSQEIANMLVISLKTVLGYRTKIMEKLDIHNRTELIKFAMRKGLISLDM
jgi:DNA-binding NarL/FixJ family response regulator